MANFKFYNIGKANAEIDSACSALAPALEKAGIKTISVDGKAVAATEAPLAAQIGALITAQPVATGSQNAAEAIASNDVISKKLDETTVALAQRTTACESLTRENARLSGELTTANATVGKLTAEAGVANTQREALVTQFNEASKNLTAAKTALAHKCISAGCLDLTGEDGKPLAKDATEDVKMAAAMKLTHEALLTSYAGALNAAAARVGIVLNTVPASNGSAAQAPAKKMSIDDEIRANKAQSAGRK